MLDFQAYTMMVNSTIRFQSPQLTGYITMPQQSIVYEKENE